MEITPKREHFIVNRATNTLFGYQGWPSVCIDERGVLYAVSSSFRCEHICPFGKTAMYMSFNQGKTWTPPIVVNDTYLDDRDAGIIYMGSGKLLVSWFCHPADIYRNHYYGAITGSAQPMEKGPSTGMLDSTYPLIPEGQREGGSFVRMSHDYGVTWGETVKVPVSAPHGPSLMSDGSLLYFGKEMYNEPAAEITKGAIGAYRSTDGGYTWKYVSELRLPEGLTWGHFHEPHVIDLGGGRLLGAIRAQGPGVAHEFTIYTTISNDNGLTWSDMRAVDVSGSPPHLLKHSSGKIIMAFGRREYPCGERALVSSDNGETWDTEYILDENRPENSDLGYPATAELPDGSLYTVYYQKYGTDGKTSILATHWEL